MAPPEINGSAQGGDEVPKGFRELCQPTPETSRSGIVIKAALAGFVIFEALAFFAPRSEFVLDFQLQVVIGWALHLAKWWPRFLADSASLMFPAIALGLVGLFGHLLVSRLILARNPANRWRFRHSASVFLLLVLGILASLSLVSSFHETRALGKGPLLRDNHDRVRLGFMFQGRNLGYVLMQFASTHNRYPVSWRELREDESIDRYFTDQVTDDFVLLAPGEPFHPDEHRPIAVSNVVPSDMKTWFCVIYGDGNSTTLRGTELDRVLAEIANRPDLPLK